MSSSYDPDEQSSSSFYILPSSSEKSSSASVLPLSGGVHSTGDTARSYKNPPEYYECLPDPNSSRTYGPVFPPLTYTYQLSFRAEAAYRSFLLPSTEIRDSNATTGGDGGTSSYRENRLVVGEDNVSGILSTYVIPSLKDVVLDGLAGLHRLREYVSDKSVRLCDSDADNENFDLNRQRRRLRTGRREEEEKQSLSSPFSDERHVVGIYPFVNEGDVESDAKHVTSNGGRIITGVKCESFGNEMEDRYPCIVIQESILLTVSSSSNINDIEFSSLQSIYHGLQDDTGWLASALESPSSYGLGISRGVIRKVKFINGAGAAAVYPPTDHHRTTNSPAVGELNGPELGLIILAALAVLMLSLCCFMYRNARVKKIVGYKIEAVTERIKKTKLAVAMQRQLDKKRINNREMMQMPQANIDVIQWREALQDAKLGSLSQMIMAKSTEDDSSKDYTTKEGSSSRSDQLSSDSDGVSVEESLELCRTGTEEAGISEDATEEIDSDDEKELGEEESKKSNATNKKLPVLMALSLASRASNTLSMAYRSSKSPKASSMTPRSSKQATESSSYTEGLTPSSPNGTTYDDPSASVDVEDPPVPVTLSGSSMRVAASSLSNESSTTEVMTFSKSAVTILGPYTDPALVGCVPVPVPAPPPADPLRFVRADPLNLSKTHSVLDVHKCSSATCKLCFQNSQIKFVSTDF
eukprot:CAMPEP_0194287498 /NCGR_PEP_ID=MMETSP0169-20130528/34865_1 /TAXON_ID=218684 /ORGANISM="Corethron pennatum, Strain L29A3" /LENGTH=695 /DNA_ID=CAMNT_0039034209 /DNA_START=142 /DNA_END=2229 /DNA_ORIENTATION=-